MPIVLHHAQSLVDPQNEIIVDARTLGAFICIAPFAKPICLRNITFQSTATCSVDQAMQLSPVPPDTSNKRRTVQLRPMIRRME
jgi:hypothetical protein